MISDQILSSAVANSTADQLAACPPIAPLPAQVFLLHRQIERAKAGGLTLSKRFSVRWVACYDAGICAGATERARDGRITLYLNACAGPDSLARTMLHELQHVADLGSTRVFSRVELERRAEDFVATCMHWNT